MSRSSELAERIHAHLRLMEADPVLNAPRPAGFLRLSPFYQAQAVAVGGRVHVQYVSYQGDSPLRLAEAERYLAWLDAGNKGKHFEVPPDQP